MQHGLPRLVQQSTTVSARVHTSHAATDLGWCSYARFYAWRFS